MPVPAAWPCWYGSTVSMSTTPADSAAVAGCDAVPAPKVPEPYRGLPRLHAGPFLGRGRALPVPQRGAAGRVGSGQDRRGGGQADEQRSGGAERATSELPSGGWERWGCGQPLRDGHGIACGFHPVASFETYRICWV